MKQDWWKWTAAFFAGVALTSVTTQAGWFVAFERDAVTRAELEQHAAQAEQKMLHETAALASGMQRQMDDLKGAIAELKSAATAERREMVTKLDELIRVTGGWRAPTAP